jgi:hypothetical protein
MRQLPTVSRCWSIETKGKPQYKGSRIFRTTRSQYSIIHATIKTISSVTFHFQVAKVFLDPTEEIPPF